MTYKFSKCPNCGKYLDAFKPTGWNDLNESVGSPVGICPSCNYVYGTGKKEWQDMDWADKVIVYARIAFGTLFGGLVAGTVLGLVVFLANTQLNWIESNSAYRTMTYTCFGIGIIYSAWAHFSELKALK